MVQKIKEGMCSDNVAQRILWLSILFFIVFFVATILSFYLLPEGFLLRKNGISDFKTSDKEGTWDFLEVSKITTR